jgi:hypothetical protein
MLDHSATDPVWWVRSCADIQDYSTEHIECQTHGIRYRTHKVHYGPILTRSAHATFPHFWTQEKELVTCGHCKKASTSHHRAGSNEGPRYSKTLVLRMATDKIVKCKNDGAKYDADRRVIHEYPCKHRTHYVPLLLAGKHGLYFNPTLWTHSLELVDCASCLDSLR